MPFMVCNSKSESELLMISNTVTGFSLCCPCLNLPMSTDSALNNVCGHDVHPAPYDSCMILDASCEDGAFKFPSASLACHHQSHVVWLCCTVYYYTNLTASLQTAIQLRTRILS